MKVLMISSDTHIFKDGSAVSRRMIEYGKLVEELHIVVLSGPGHKPKERKIAGNVWVYATNSLFSFWRPLDAVGLGKNITKDKKFTSSSDLVTSQDPFECGWSGLKIKNFSGLALEVQLHTDPFSPYFTGFKNFVRKTIARKILRCADSIRVVSETLKNEVSRLTSARIVVLPIYIDKERIENSEAAFDLHQRYPWRFVILAVSRLSHEKNLGLVLRVLAKVRKKFSSAGLVVVGAGPEKTRLKNLAKKLNLSKAVAFVGWQEDIASFYKTANLFIQTSYFEGYGLSLVEAGLSGLPVVTTPVGIAKELVHDKEALIFPQNDINKFAAGIIDLIENNHKRDYLGINLKNTLEAKLLSKDDYLSKLKESWGGAVIGKKQ